MDDTPTRPTGSAQSDHVLVPFSYFHYRRQADILDRERKALYAEIEADIRAEASQDDQGSYAERPDHGGADRRELEYPAEQSEEHPPQSQHQQANARLDVQHQRSASQRHPQTAASGLTDLIILTVSIALFLLQFKGLLF